MRPSDFSYKHEAKHNSTLVVAELWEDEGNSDDLLLENLTSLLKYAKACRSSHIVYMVHNDDRRSQPLGAARLTFYDRTYSVSMIRRNSMNFILIYYKPCEHRLMIIR